jgi:catechol 2,3-dioxygenase-like lactoylglutathione lyase family enzyme
VRETSEMTAPIEGFGYHVGIVVNDIEAATARYGALFGGTFRSFEYTKPASRIAERPSAGARLRLAYGRYGGMTLEFVEPRDAGNTYAVFLERHGPGVHHLGFWVPNLPRAVEAALERGGQVTSATITASGSAAISFSDLTPSDAAAFVGEPAAFLDIGAGPELEFVGPAGVQNLGTLLGDKLAHIVDLPPWASASH